MQAAPKPFVWFGCLIRPGADLIPVSDHPCQISYDMHLINIFNVVREPGLDYWDAAGNEQGFLVEALGFH
jgi:hypothetical protein